MVESHELNHSLRAFSRRKVLLGMGMASVAAVAQARLPAPNREPLAKEKLAALVPNQIGEWTFAAENGLILPPEDALSDRLYDNLLTRIYTSPAGKAVMLLIAYNNRQDGVVQIHRPEICYPAGGFVLSPTISSEIALPAGQSLPVQIFSARGQARDEVVLYWSRIGSDFPRKWSQQRLAVARANLNGVIPDGLLARVSTFGSDITGEAPVLKRFVLDMEREAPALLNNLLFNTPLKA